MAAGDCVPVVRSESGLAAGGRPHHVGRLWPPDLGDGGDDLRPNADADGDHRGGPVPAQRQCSRHRLRRLADGAHQHGVRVPLPGPAQRLARGRVAGCRDKRHRKQDSETAIA